MRVRIAGRGRWRAEAGRREVCEGEERADRRRAAGVDARKSEPGDKSGRAHSWYQVTVEAGGGPRRRDHRRPVLLLQLRMSRNYNGPPPNGGSLECNADHTM